MSEDLVDALSSRTCEVCHAVGVIGVVCSIAGPSSHAVCQACFDIGAEPWSNMVYLRASEDVGDWIDPIVDVSIQRSGKTKEEFDSQVEDLKKHFLAMSEP